MKLIGFYVHNIDPIIFSICGVHIWWYGLGFFLGFLNVFLYTRRAKKRLGLTTKMGYDLAILVSTCVLICGRLVEVLFYELQFFLNHPYYIPAYWLGGMATHGLLIGGIMGIIFFCWIYKKPFLEVSDVLSVAAAFILTCGRFGNFIDGQIVGSVTDVFWAVKFPDADGFRHPVVLYDGIKNFLIIPLLIWVGKKQRSPGFVTGLFLFLYAFLRIFIDLFRLYPASFLGFATGQMLNIIITLVGLSLLLWRIWKPSPAKEFTDEAKPLEDNDSTRAKSLLSRRLLLLFIMLFSLTIPSDMVQDIPARYGKRHPGLHYSWLYPKIDITPAQEFIDKLDSSTEKNNIPIKPEP